MCLIFIVQTGTDSVECICFQLYSGLMVWHLTTYRASAHYWPRFLVVPCYVLLTQTNYWSHGLARLASVRVPSCLLARLHAWNEMPAHLRKSDLT